MRNYLIIGGSSGIGKELVNLLKEQGATIFATYYKNVVENSIENIRYQKFDVLSDTLDLDELPEEIHGLAYCPGKYKFETVSPFYRRRFYTGF